MIKKLIISLVLALLLQSCINLRQPSITFQKSEIKLINFQEAEVKFSFDLANDNMIPLNGVVNYELFIDDRSFLNGTSSQIDVGSNSNTVFYISNKIDLLKIFDTVNSLITAVTSGKKSIPLELKGSFKTQAGIFPLETPFSVKESLPLPTLEQVLTRK